MRSLKMVAYVVGIVASAIYILNPTAGVWELLPDNLPLLGNLDEAAMTAVLLSCLRGVRTLRRETLGLAEAAV
jgi:uncharacterized membrane protein YkvA (DUF1232 family)